MGKRAGYYGVDYTGSLPERVEDQTLSVRIVNSGGMLGVECDIADYLNAKENTQYEFRVFSLRTRKKDIRSPSTPTRSPTRRPPVERYGRSRTTTQKPRSKKRILPGPWSIKRRWTRTGPGTSYGFLDVFSEWNAYNLHAGLGIAIVIPTFRSACSMRRLRHGRRIRAASLP